MKSEIIIEQDGTVRAIYDEAIRFGSLGQPSIRRASHVEPNEDGQWTADLSPMDGPSLGPFAVRSDALQAEREWLEVNWLTSRPGCPGP